MAVAAPDEVEYGEVFTHLWVVGTIVDFVGFTPDKDPSNARIL
ncbi:hypothetical protein [Microbacterium sp.]|nr:hypothetical protein [Microbacterium sp.]